LYPYFKSSPGVSDFKIPALKKKIRDLEFNPERYFNKLFLTNKERIQIGKQIEKKAKLIKKIEEVLSPVEKRRISEEIKDINNLVREKIKPLKFELSKKLAEEEKKMKQSKVYTFREFPYCFFSTKTLCNLLNL